LTAWPRLGALATEVEVADLASVGRDRRPALDPHDPGVTPGQLDHPLHAVTAPNGPKKRLRDGRGVEDPEAWMHQ
jgi:hypothetical protein